MKMPEKRIELVNLQLTGNCNLRCHFCGQWGDHGFFANCEVAELSLEEWKTVVDSLIRYRAETGNNPRIILWGGECLVYPGFEAVVEYLRTNSFALETVTNGVLLDKYSGLLRDEFSTIYVSIDGPEKIHDSIRGEGVFAKVSGNIPLLKGGKPEIVFMTTICPENLEILPELPYLFADCGADKILFQELIYLSSQEISEYKKWLCSRFGIKATKIDSWHIDLPPGYRKRKNLKLKEMLHHQQAVPAKALVEYLPHGIANRKHCLSPFRHLHVTRDGSVLFCTDFYDFSAGNVRNENLIDIWNGKLAERFRREVMRGNCPTCRHCAWKGNRYYSFEKEASSALTEP